MNIQFNFTSLANQTFNSQTPTSFFFEGRNFEEPIKVDSKTTSCGCTTVACPDTLEESFTVVVTVDKRNQSGYVSEFAEIRAGGKTFKLHVSGQIK